MALGIARRCNSLSTGSWVATATAQRSGYEKLPMNGASPMKIHQGSTAGSIRSSFPKNGCAASPASQNRTISLHFVLNWRLLPIFAGLQKT
jgi:hypothetical protein